MTHPLRRAAILLVEQPCFERFVLLVIVANCAMMAWHSPLDPPGTDMARFLEAFEGVSLAVFTVELVVKVRTTPRAEKFDR